MCSSDLYSTRTCLSEIHLHTGQDTMLGRKLTALHFICVSFFKGGSLFCVIVVICLAHTYIGGLIPTKNMDVKSPATLYIAGSSPTLPTYSTVCTVCKLLWIEQICSAIILQLTSGSCCFFCFLFFLSLCLG